MSDRAAMSRGGTVYRIHWTPGADLLVGVCHCGAEHDSEDPVDLWDWLLAHPEGHGPPTAVSPPTADRHPVGAHP
ncbi:hypothetical protein F4560_001662 [Saccharothrix ecbatanensis]|uniref:Uncharacterized protein n=1 Tax=Saccharothrix ecbatanensis TaxID=1105145 RepID=A0A7W9HH80_9PSEU|nr:hypothetical protein [Saccharothrix ecbatanensis]MBB5801894.1 hypothetical protein [Saccharothrix ecbatanensis]